MIIDEKLLTKLEKLTAFKIPEEKREETKSQLDEILSFVEILNELDLSGDDIAITALKGSTPLREDIPAQNGEVIKIILDHAPSRDNNYFVVPKIIE